jgi:hypothetical protein
MSPLSPESVIRRVLTRSMTNTDEIQVLDELTDRLHTKYPDAPLGSIKSMVFEVHHQYDGHPIRDFIPVLVEREVSEHFRAGHGRRIGVAH